MPKLFLSTLIAALAFSPAFLAHAQDNGGGRDEESFLERVLPFIKDRHDEVRQERGERQEEQLQQNEAEENAALQESEPAPLSPTTSTPIEPPPVIPAAPQEVQPQESLLQTAATTTPFASGAVINPHGGSGGSPLYETQAEQRAQGALLFILSAGFLASGLLLTRTRSAQRDPLAARQPRHA